MKIWVKAAKHPPIRKRATRVALIVGTVLVLINHGDALLQGQLDWVRAVKIVLTYMVPYMVSTHSAVAATLDGQNNNQSDHR